MKEWLKAERPEDVGKFYDEKYIQHGDEAFREDRKQIFDFMKQWAFPSGGNFDQESMLLDAGCGNGQFVDYMSDHLECAGIEISEKAFEIARKKTIGKAMVKRMAIEDIPWYWNDRFDYVTCLGVLEHTMDPSVAFKKLMVCLKFGGWLFVTVPVEFDDCFQYIRLEKNTKTNERFASIDEWISLFGKKEQGFSMFGHGIGAHVAIAYKKEEA